MSTSPQEPGEEGEKRAREEGERKDSNSNKVPPIFDCAAPPRAALFEMGLTDQKPSEKEVKDMKRMDRLVPAFLLAFAAFIGSPSFLSLSCSL